MLSRCCIIGGGASGPCRLEHTSRSGPLLSDCSSLSHYNEVRELHCSLLWTSQTYKPTSITLISYKRLILVKKRKSLYLILTAYCWTFEMWVLFLRWTINIHTYMYISWLTDFRSSYWQGNCQYLPSLEFPAEHKTAFAKHSGFMRAAASIVCETTWWQHFCYSVYIFKVTLFCPIIYIYNFLVSFRLFTIFTSLYYSDY